MIIDLSLRNNQLYAGCKVEEINGRLNLAGSRKENQQIVGKNIETFDIDPNKIELTGPMAVWAYLLVFHAVVHRTREVWYNDGRENELVAKHG